MDNDWGYSKEEANYHLARSGAKRRCSKCRYFYTHSYHGTLCEKVRGKIIGRFVCRFWKSK